MIFGHQDDQKNKQTNNEQSDDSFSLGSQPTVGATSNDNAPSTAPLSQNDPLAFGNNGIQQSALDQGQGPIVDNNATSPTPDSTALSDESADLASIPPKPDTPSVIKPHEFAKDSEEKIPEQIPTDLISATTGADELLELKQKALNDLGPLVDHLDQTPEEKFRTTMMLIQSTDNESLIKEAYAAATSISEEKVRAQALLDVVNEINYFTHKKETN